ncbi:hypothetical protein [uncultured Brevundimonas sp.]|uniref:hypothetical protein n=1 Tax=uncultured Brevundimonas sp. TaxID=213418 RepID=UPI002609E22B|nr:hypothetical protein [uncultured Brevundimonas sp.]
MKTALLSLGLGLLGCAPTVSHAQTPSDPFVFVIGSTETADYVWWSKASLVRPTGTVVSGVALDALNAARGEDENKWCFANALSAASFTSPFRSIQAAIDETMRDEYLPGFQASGSFTGQGDQDAVVGNFEDCYGNQGAFLLITNREEPRQVVYVREWADWKGFIWLSKNGDELSVGSCLYCDDVRTLSYDRARGRFYWPED